MIYFVEHKFLAKYRSSLRKSLEEKKRNLQAYNIFCISLIIKPFPLFLFISYELYNDFIKCCFKYLRNITFFFHIQQFSQFLTNSIVDFINALFESVPNLEALARPRYWKRSWPLITPHF